MSQNAIAALQSLLIFLQICNVGVLTVTKDPLVALLITAAVGSVQFFVTHVAVHTISPEVSVVLTPDQKTKIAASKEPNGECPPKAASDGPDTKADKPSRAEK